MSIGGGWIKPQHALPGETVRWSRAANRMQGSRAVGGKLFLTERRILFSPNRIDGLTGGSPWAIDLPDVSEVGIEPMGSGKAAKLGGGLRNRLRVRGGATGESLFVINRLEEEVLPTLRAAVDGSRS